MLSANIQTNSGQLLAFWLFYGAKKGKTVLIKELEGMYKKKSNKLPVN